MLYCVLNEELSTVILLQRCHDLFLLIVLYLFLFFKFSTIKAFSGSNLYGRIQMWTLQFSYTNRSYFLNGYFLFLGCKIWEPGQQIKKSTRKTWFALRMEGEQWLYIYLLVWTFFFYLCKLITASRKRVKLRYQLIKIQLFIAGIEIIPAASTIPRDTDLGKVNMTVNQRTLLE